MSGWWKLVCEQNSAISKRDIAARVVIAEEEEALVNVLDLQAIEVGQLGVSLDLPIVLPDLVDVSPDRV
ncbi:hypothetical protein PanWU01x14_055470 [Parasponia andersonii]|uniref:Uncharacterized protein n=1 Tax=Parasponia andersonii TaxID=3476 RepID=A0A2P5DL19_PARAD|nr:hypothetical protein PanWU01x14_055470 [Parasponia andersonii]